MENYFVVNLETGKLELHFEKETYQALTEDQKKEIKSNFLWGRNSGCWISRAKEPNLTWARRVAVSLGLEDAGKEGERLSFAEQMERKAERAERRADRYENRADAAERKGEALQAPINEMHGDIAFFTQPNINTSAGRAFTNRRNKMFAAFERGFDEFRKSAYWSDRAKTARATAAQKELKDKAFVSRRIKERESDIRKMKKGIEEQERVISRIESGETVTNWRGEPVQIEAARSNLEYWLDRLEAKLDELGFYQDCLAELGGVSFSRENIKPGYIVRVQRWGVGEVISAGPKNCTVKTGNFPLTHSYAEILEIVKATEAAQEAHPYKVGESITCTRWNKENRKSEKVEYKIIRATDKTITLQAGEEKPITRKPRRLDFGNRDWCVSITDYNDSIWRKPAELDEKEEAPASMTPEEFAATIQ